MAKDSLREKGEFAPFSERQWILLVLTALGLALAVLAAIRLFDHKPNVLLITIDTLRPDRLSCYGCRARTSPNIDRIAREGYVFERCYASSSWTLPSVMTIHTGLYPFSHGVEWVNKKLPSEVPTLAEILRANGYDTGAVESSLFLQSQFGFGRGFDRYEEKPISDHRAVSSPMLTERALAWLRQHQHQPFFYWIHYLDPHYDYLFHPQARRFMVGVPEDVLEKEYSILELKRSRYSLRPEEYEHQSRLYNGEISFTDRHIGRLVEFLESSGQWDDTWIIVTSDHGEMLGEYGALGHTEWYYEQVLRVPLIIKPPKGVAGPAHVSDPVSIADVVPTLLRALKLRGEPAEFDGELLLPSQRHANEAFSPRDSVWARTNTPKVNFTARLGKLKCVYQPRTKTKLVFDVQGEPHEDENLLEKHQDRFEIFLQEAERMLQEQPEPADDIDVRADFLEQMGALGYLGAGRTP